MKLTELEQCEMQALREKRKSKTEWMSQEQQDRQQYLRIKQLHNCCMNLKCEGYEGTDNERFCPKCEMYLFKAKNVLV